MLGVKLCSKSVSSVASAFRRLNRTCVLFAALLAKFPKGLKTNLE